MTVLDEYIKARSGESDITSDSCDDETKITYYGFEVLQASQSPPSSMPVSLFVPAGQSVFVLQQTSQTPCSSRPVSLHTPVGQSVYRGTCSSRSVSFHAPAGQSVSVLQQASQSPCSSRPVSLHALESQSVSMLHVSIDQQIISSAINIDLNFATKWCNKFKAV